MTGMCTALHSEFVTRTEGRNLSFSTFYAGGGTPTLLPPEFWHSMIAAVRSPALGEVTIETNPAVLDRTGYSTLLMAGFNRISLGIQSFNERALKKLGRIHSAEQGIEAMKLTRETGFRNISTDLIYGHPGQTIQEHRRDIDQLLLFMPHHISLYELTLEKGTPMGEAGRKVSDKLCSDMYHQADRVLSENGYIHYEVSSYALEKKYIAQHNSAYWKRIPYMGIGPSAHSFTGTRRTWNTSNSVKYESAVIRGESPVESGEDLTGENGAHEILALGFRHTGGVSLADLRRTGYSLNPQELLKTGMVTIKQDSLVPSVRGMLFADSLALQASELLEELPGI